MQRLIDISELHVAYGSSLVLEGIDMHLDQGEIAVILGGSGCGKSTLLKTIIGLVSPRSGHVEILGQNLPELNN